MTNNNFYTPTEVRPLYDSIIPAYQTAFAGEPWNEVSKCVDVRQRCVGGLSSAAIGSLCNTCTLRPTSPAYEYDEMTKRFDNLAASRPTAWYTEQEANEVVLAAVAWKATPQTIAEEKYADVPEMEDWMLDKLGNQDVAWLDDIFANRQLRKQGNLRNFGKIITGLADGLNTGVVAYRTIAPQMTSAAMRDFRENAAIAWRPSEGINPTVPDRRNFIIINVDGEQ